jgi:outer membrane protein assembly factor BamB
MYAVNVADGSLRWKFSGGNWFWARAVALNNTVYAPCLDGKVYALNAESGSKVVEFNLGSPISSSPVLVNSLIIVATGEGGIFSIDTGINQKRQLVNVKELADEDLTVNSPLVASEGIVYVHAQTKKHGSLLYALNAQTGLDLWHYSPQSSK